MKLSIPVIAFFVLAILHHDFWNWDNSNLVFGFLPAGLGYHALYSVVAATFWALIVKFAWPSHIEEWAEQTDAE